MLRNYFIFWLCFDINYYH